MNMKILPDQSENSSHGRFQDKETAPDPIIIFLKAQWDNADNTGHHQAEENDWLPSNDVHRERVH